MDTTKLQTIPASSPEDRRERTDRRAGAERRMGLVDRRVQQKFVLFDRRKNTGRRLLSGGRRYCPDRRNTNRRVAG